MDAVTLSPERWYEVCQRIIVSWGAPPDIAACVAHSLVESNLAGVDSHGVIRIVNYYAYVKPGWWRAAGRPEVVRDGPATAVVEGNWGFGQPAMHLAVGIGVAKAREQGVAGVGVIHTAHIGRLGEYAEKAAAAGALVMLGTNNGCSGGHVVPHGGAERMFSTNPIAAAAPAGNHTPFLMDFATTVVAAGKLELTGEADRPIPPGWAVDRDGRPATTARQYLDGGALLPVGGHKGYALALLTELVAGALTGGGVSQHPDTPPTGGLGFGGNATFLVVLDIASFTEREQFLADADALFDRLNEVKPAPGFDRVIVPGEPEAEKRRIRAAEGITVPGSAWQEIARIAAECQVEIADIRPGVRKPCQT